MKSPHPRALVVGALALLAVLIGWRWLLPLLAGRPAPKAPPAIAVDVASVNRADVPIYLEGLGTVQAFYTVTITPRVDGQLQTLAFIEGQTVKQGDLLAQIDPRPFQAALDSGDRDARQGRAPSSPTRSATWSATSSRPAGPDQQADAGHAARAGRAADGAGQRRPGGDRQRADPARLHHDPLADPRPHRHPPGRPGQQRARAATRRHRRRHPVAADLGDLHACPRTRLAAADRGAAERRGHGRRAGARRQDRARHGHGGAGRQPDRPDHRHHPPQGDLPQQGQRLWPGEFVTARVLARRGSRRSPFRRPPCSAARRHVRLRREAGFHGRGASAADRRGQRRRHVSSTRGCRRASASPPATSTACSRAPHPRRQPAVPGRPHRTPSRRREHLDPLHPAADRHLAPDGGDPPGGARRLSAAAGGAAAAGRLPHHPCRQRTCRAPARRPWRPRWRRRWRTSSRRSPAWRR